MNKLAYKSSKEETKNLLSQNISVLLYELTTKYTTFEMQCETLCEFTTNDGTYQRPSAIISFLPEGMFIARSLTTNSFPFTEITVSSQDTIIKIANYDRRSYAGIPRNTFRGKLLFQKESYQTVDGAKKTGFVVINQLPFSDYLKGVVETNDQEHLEKNKVMALIAKNYALFYLNKKNIHPSIPAESSYDAIDSPEMFQKYVGAGAEKTLTKRYEALEATKNQVVLYS
jgi:peptidoglycan hydrolase-like amidase